MSEPGEVGLRDQSHLTLPAHSVPGPSLSPLSAERGKSHNPATNRAMMTMIATCMLPWKATART